jgi:ABC-type phosphate/phosphonate transport system substrate-binding protein
MKISAACAWLVVSSLLPVGLWAAGDGDITVRYAISERLLTGLNMNDARAAFAVWADQIVASSGLRLRFGDDVVFSREKLVRSLKAGEVDLIGLGVTEVWDFREYLDTTQFISDPAGGYEMVLLVRQDAGVEKMSELRDRAVIIWQGPGTDLADAWMYSNLRKAGLPPPDRHFRRVTRNTKLSQAVFPVFFGQADACIVTRKGLATMVELNPQIGKRLKVLAVSPRVQSAIFVCRKSFPIGLRKEVFRRAVGLQKNPGTQQVLTLFQATGYAEFPGTELRSSVEILEEYRKWLAGDAAQGR